MRGFPAVSLTLLVAMLALTPLLSGCGGGGAPPAADGLAQPATGPGSAVYDHAGFQVYQSGSAATDYWLYTPTDPVPRSAPVVIFNHGWSALTPAFYEAWIIHLVRKGNAVIFPRWQAFVGDLNGSAFLPNAATAVRAALTRMDTVGPVASDRSQVAVFGHSIGGVLAADMAADWATLALPQPLACFSVEPGSVTAATGVFDPDDVTISDFSQIPAATLLVSLVGEDDLLVGDTLARQIYQQSTTVLAANKNLLTVHSDNHGAPALTANHLFPLASADGSNVDALDYYALWKTGDALLDAAFRGTNREYALGNTAEQRYMGTWPDGTPVTEMAVE
ncbi:MAG: alpha/beta hydrolase [Armatimonadetes bacterium]|nr:alpha/beta hydrolase [Armatimonadota bacterium]